jgi:N-acetylglutamate synthase-like GNAT family acetyltransferase
MIRHAKIEDAATISALIEPYSDDFVLNAATMLEASGLHFIQRRKEFAA